MFLVGFLSEEQLVWKVLAVFRGDFEVLRDYPSPGGGLPPPIKKVDQREKQRTP